MMKSVATSGFPQGGGLTRYRPRQPGLMAVVIGTLVLAVLSGMLIGVGGKLMGAVLIGACLLAASFFVPLPLTFWILVVTTFVLVGPLQYFAGLEKIFWFPYLFGLLLLFRAAVAIVFASRLHEVPRQRLPWLETPLILFAFTLVASTVLNFSPILQVLVAAKEYFFLWGACFAVVGGIVAVRSLDRLWDALPWFLLLQFPAVVYQRFVVATSRIGGASWDAVVGLFGGDPQQGGASGAMAMCAVIAIAFAITHWRRGLMPGWKVLLTAGLGLATIMLAEVKLAIVLIPVAILMIYGRDLLARPMRSLAMLCAALVASFAIIYAYQSQYTTTATKAGRSLGAYIVDAFEKNTKVDYIDPITKQMGRVGAITHWWREQHAGDPLSFTIGNGIGASRLGLVKGEVARRYPFDIERSSIVILLWDSGVLGLLAVVAALLAGAGAAFRLARQSSDEKEAAILQATGVGLSVVLLSLPYGPDFVRVPQFQLFAILLLARVAVAARWPMGRASAPNPGRGQASRRGRFVALAPAQKP